MKRLTSDANFCDIHLCDPDESTCGGSCARKRIWDRLREYENTGLTPEEILELIRKQGDTA